MLALVTYIVTLVTHIVMCLTCYVTMKNTVFRPSLSIFSFFQFYFARKFEWFFVLKFRPNFLIVNYHRVETPYDSYDRIQTIFVHNL